MKCVVRIAVVNAAMLMILAQAHPHETEDAVVRRLLQIRPQAWPNSRMIGFADERLGHSAMQAGDGLLGGQLHLLGQFRR